MKIAIIGLGNMGSFFYNSLKKENEVFVFDKNKNKLDEISKKHKIETLSKLSVLKPELVLNAVPLSKTTDTFKTILPYISEKCVLCDIASVKGNLKDFYSSIENRFISIHPMYGPTFGVLQKLESENAVIIKESDSSTTEFFKDFFHSLGIRVFNYTFEEHDKMMAYSLSLPFISSFVFSACTNNTTVPGTTFKKHQKIAKRLLAEDHHLLSEILFNPHTVEQLRLVSGKMEHLKHIINGKDYEESIKFIGKLKENLANGYVKNTTQNEESILATEGVQKLSPYVPGKTIEEVAKQNNLQANSIVKLASNENPLGAPPEVKNAIVNSVDKISLYPDGSSKELKIKISEKFNIKTENIIIGNGSSEIIENVCMAFMKEKSNALVSEFGFGLYKKAILAANHSYLSVPDENLGHSTENFLKNINKFTKVIFISNPNNPTGTIIEQKKLKIFVEKVPKNILIVLDEAYIEYTNINPKKGGLSLVKEHNNLLVLRTFSKVYGLAGLRVGYGFAHSSIIEALDKVRTPTNITSLAQLAALKALDCDEHVKESVKQNKIEMKFLTENLQKLNLEVIESHGNFLLINVKQKGSTVVEKMEKAGVIVRGMDSYKLFNYIRVTVGTRKENKKFISVLTQALIGII